MSKGQLKLVKVLATVVWIFGCLMILGPGMASKNPQSPNWFWAGFVVQTTGLLILLVCSINTKK